MRSRQALLALLAIIALAILSGCELLMQLQGAAPS
jgi:hypothetical protein